MEGGDTEQRWQRQANVCSKRADGATTNRVLPDVDTRVQWGKLQG